MSTKQRSGEFILEMQAIAKSYGSVRVLEDVGLSLRPGRCAVLPVKTDPVNRL